jgi:hypothetical protein
MTLVRLSIDTAFIPSLANVIGTALPNYGFIQKDQLACDRQVEAYLWVNIYIQQKGWFYNRTSLFAVYIR